MSVDTREKRSSLIGYGLPFRLTLPVADGSIDSGDRRHLLGLYASQLGTVYTESIALVSDAVLAVDQVAVAVVSVLLAHSADLGVSLPSFVVDIGSSLSAQAQLSVRLRGENVNFVRMLLEGFTRPDITDEHWASIQIR